jgi:hypothetical protein
MPTQYNGARSHPQGYPIVPFVHVSWITCSVAELTGGRFGSLAEAGIGPTLGPLQS